MQKKKKILIFMAITCLIVIGIFLFMFFKSKDKNSDEAIIKDDVYIITEEIEGSLIELNEDSLIFNKEMNYEIGDVIVSGITEKTPNGFIKIVVDSYIEDEKNILKTEEGFLTDVFEELHIKRKFTFTEDGLEENISSKDNGINGLVATKFIDETLYRNLATKIKLSDKEKADYEFIIEQEIKLDSGNIIDVSVGCNFELELIMDIENEELVYGMIVNSDIGGGLGVSWSEKASWETSGTIKEIKLPNLQFTIGIVPIVLTNEVNIGYEIESEISGGIKTEVEVDSIANIGFIYDSTKREIEKISEYEYLADGLSFGTSAFAKGEIYGGLTTHIASKLYGVSGGYIGGGIGTKIEGEVALKEGIIVSAETLDTEHAEASFTGSLDLSVIPKVEGGIIKTDAMDAIDFDINFDDIKNSGENDNKDNEQVKDKDTEKDSEKDKEKDKEKDSEKDSEKDKGKDSKKDKEKDTSNDEKTPLFVIELKPIWEYHWEIFDENNTYITKDDSLPLFSFNYSDNWTIKQEEVNEEIGYEMVVLSNDRGVEVTYYSLEMGFGTQYHGGGYELLSAHIIEVSDALFIPKSYEGEDYSSLGKFVVAKVKVFAYEDGLTGESESNYDGPTYYAIVPESYLGDDYFSSSGYYSVCSWKYVRPMVVLVNSPDGKFTEDEEKEVIEILSSFRLVEED